MAHAESDRPHRPTTRRPDSISRWFWRIGYLALAAIMLPHLAVATAVNAQRVQASSGRGCRGAASDASYSWPWPLAELSTRAHLRRLAADEAHLTAWESEVIRPAQAARIPVDSRVLRSMLAWKLPCSPALLAQIEAAAVSGAPDQQMLAEELRERRTQLDHPMPPSPAGEPSADSVAQIARSLGLPADDVSLGDDLLRDGTHCEAGVGESAGSPLWTSYDYRDDTRFNAGFFAVGWDCHDTISGRGALRATGVWRAADPNLWPITATFATTAPMPLLPGPYLFSAAYRTGRDASPLAEIAVDPVLPWHELPTTNDRWAPLVLVLWADVPVNVIALLRNSGVGTAWFDDMQFRRIQLAAGRAPTNRSSQVLAPTRPPASR